MNQDEIARSLRQYKETNKEKYHILRLGFFGSAARDGMSEGSDIDVVVELTEPDLFSLIGIKQELEEKLDRPVEIVRYRKEMNAFLKRRIDREAVYV